MIAELLIKLEVKAVAVLSTTDNYSALVRCRELRESMSFFLFLFIPVSEAQLS